MMPANPPHRHERRRVRPRVATYRLQFHAGFTFADAIAILDYLVDLGISDVYCSPYLQAQPGSTHGYDVVDHERVNREIGGLEGHAAWVQALQDRGLRQLLDIVPNHMAIAADNRWWRDVLEHGQASRFAGYFDIEWDAPEARLRNLLLLPVLGDQYGIVLERGDLALVREGATFGLRSPGDTYPVDPRSLGPVLRDAAGGGSEALAFIADALEALPAADAGDAASAARRHRDHQVIRRLLARLLDDEPDTAAQLDRVIAAINTDADRLHLVIDAQPYRLAWWRTSGQHLGYRRFFDVNSLAGLRVEDERVFRDTHARVLEWMANGQADGVRIDHIDGLRDPARYLDRLRARAPSAWILCEKILAPDEWLPEAWPVDGTTGYEFLNRVLGLFVDPAAEPAFTAFASAFTGESAPFPAVALDGRRRVLDEALGSDVNRLADLLLRICERRRRLRDYSRQDAVRVIRELLAAFPVYRTYVRPEAGDITLDDRARIDAAVGAAADALDVERPLLDFAGQLLRAEVDGALEAEFAARFQQTSGPAAAKGVEDTALYRQARFIALNEVGGDPARFGLTPAEFHAAAARTLTTWPTTLLATATHDTKRGEDVRARLAALSEVPDDWFDAVRRWSEWGAPLRTGDQPSRTDEYFLYQTLVGAWPIDRDRTRAYMQKAMREAKVATSWTSVNADYERAVEQFINGLFADTRWLADIDAFVRRVQTAGWINSLAQMLIKLTAPGVPDVYQGTELWSLDLVDPDNRRPVDYAARQRLLERVRTMSADAVWREQDSGAPKLWLLFRALQVRRTHLDAFGPDGTYAVLDVTGAHRDRIVGFSRADRVATIVPRLAHRVVDWRDTTIALPPGDWEHALTGQPLSGTHVRAAELFERFPVALLTAREPRP